MNATEKATENETENKTKDYSYVLVSPPQNLTRREAAAYLRISPTKLDEEVASFLLRPTSIGRRKIFRLKELNRYLDLKDAQNS